jgi:hypothetical protein
LLQTIKTNSIEISTRKHTLCKLICVCKEVSEVLNLKHSVQ